MQPGDPTGDEPAASFAGGRFSLATSALLLVVIGGLYCMAADWEMLGFIHDDGVYVISAKALASGQGFTLLNVPGAMPQLKYPFGVPALLTPVWWAISDFPRNIPLFNAVIITFSLGAFWVLQDYLRRWQGFPGWLAWVVVLLVAFNFHVLHYTTAVMSEGPYLFFSLLALWAASRMARESAAPSNRALLGLAVLSALCIQMRVLGLALTMAVFAWLLLQGQRRGAILYGGVSFMLGALPWLLWTRLQAPAVNELNFPLVNTYNSYTREYAHNLEALGYDLLNVLGSLNERVVEALFSVIRNLDHLYPALKGPVDTILFALCNALLLLWFGGQFLTACRSAWREGRPARAFSIPALYLAIYMVMITLWNYPEQMARFVGVVSPLLWLYFFKPLLPVLQNIRLKWPLVLLAFSWLLWPAVDGWQAWIRLAMAGAMAVTWWYGQKAKEGRSWQGLAIILALALAFWPMSHNYQQVATARQQHLVDNGKYPELWGEYRQAFGYIRRELPKDAAIATRSDTVFYLYTDRPAFYLFHASLRRQDGRLVPGAYEQLMKSLDYYQVRYLVMEPHIFLRVVRHPQNQVARQLMVRFPDRFQRIWQSERGMLSIYRILPES